MQNPFFSVVLPTYNRAHLISPAIQSVINQQFTGWELIIVDDGSTDNTREIVSKFNVSNIRYIWQTNQERSAARNKGIELASGSFICFLDSDDTWRRNHLEALFQAITLNKEKPALYFTGMCWNFPENKQDVIFKSPEGENPVEYVIANQIGTPTVSINHTILKELRFNTSLRINEDVEFFARVVAQSGLIQIPVVTVDVIIHPENTKGLVKDFVSPQILAMKTIFQNPTLKNRISDSFKRKVFKNLRHQLINYYSDTEQFPAMNKEILRFLVSYPFDAGNKVKLVSLLYHMPGGEIIKSVIRSLKR